MIFILTYQSDSPDDDGNNGVTLNPAFRNHWKRLVAQCLRADAVWASIIRLILAICYTTSLITFNSLTKNTRNESITFRQTLSSSYSSSTHFGIHFLYNLSNRNVFGTNRSISVINFLIGILCFDSETKWTDESIIRSIENTSNEDLMMCKFVFLECEVEVEVKKGKKQATGSFCSIETGSSTENIRNLTIIATETLKLGHGPCNEAVTCDLSQVAKMSRYEIAGDCRIQITFALRMS